MIKIKIIRLFFVALLFFLITGIPYFYGWWISTPSIQFTGFVYNHEDEVQYFSFARQALEGKLLFEDRYTTEPHPRILINWFWWGTGQLMKWTGWEIPVSFQAYRFLILLVFIGTLFVFLGRYLEGNLRWMGLVLILWGGGFGGIVRIFRKSLNIIPNGYDFDVWLMESHAFLSMMVSPIYNLAVALMLLVYLFFLKGMENQQNRNFALAGLFSLLLLFFHPFEFGVVFPVLMFTAILLWLSNWKRNKSAFWGITLFLLISLPGLIYNYYLSRQPVWGEVMNQMALITPDPLQIGFCFGLPFFLTLITFRGLPSLKKVNPTQALLFSWAVVGFFLLYLPVKFQWHLINGWQVPLYILALKGLEERILPYVKEKLTHLSNWKERKLKVISYTLIFLFASITPCYVIQAKIKNTKTHFGQLPYYLHSEELAAINWLRAHSQSGVAILSGPEMGNILPGWTGNKVFVGHYCITPKYEEKIKIVKGFWDQNNVFPDRMDWLRKQGVRYIYRGVEEKGIGSYDPGQEVSIKKVFSINRSMIFKVE